MVLGFYGGGLVVCAAAFIAGFLRPKFRAILQTVAIALVSLAVVYYLIFLIKPNVIEYNVANIKKLTTFDLNRSPRKIISFYNYFTSYPRDAKDFLFGSGPGTFNSRSAFMVGSPSYFDKVGFFKESG